MYCPQCQIPVVDKHCSQCGIKITTKHGDKHNRVTPSPSWKIVELASRSQQPKQDGEALNWKLEVKHKIEKHHDKKQSSPSLPQHQHKATFTPDFRKPKQPANHSLFEYGLMESTEESSRVSRTRKTASKTPTEKPLLRESVKTQVASSLEFPSQKNLKLELSPSSSEIQLAEEPDPEESRVSNEIIFSRLLAGIIDLSFPILVAALFTFAASLILQFEFFSEDSIWIEVGFSVGFYFFNSFFFLSVSQQTPGMYFTDLRLIGEDSEEIHFVLLFIRITFFLPVAVTVLGLLTAIFDPWCRCLHDRLSKTRVVPLST